MIENPSNPLLGSWVSDPTEPAIWKRLGQVTLDFFPEGTLRKKYVNKHGVTELKHRYYIENNILITSSPPLHDARNKFKITPEGKLIMYEGRRRYPYVRKP